jgi:hypothetical protein
MSPEPSDRCPRCGGAFHCGAGDPAPCACTSLKLDVATLATLRERYSGCLCLPCLRDIAAQAGALTPAAAPPRTSRGCG